MGRCISIPPGFKKEVLAKYSNVILIPQRLGIFPRPDKTVCV